MISESGFLATQAEDATAAVMRTLRTMKDDAATFSGLRLLRRHPWLALGSAVIAGCVAGAVWPAHRASAGDEEAMQSCQKQASKQRDSSPWLAALGAIGTAIVRASIPALKRAFSTGQRIQFSNARFSDGNGAGIELLEGE